MKSRALFIFLCCFYSVNAFTKPSVHLWKNQWVVPLLSNDNPPESDRFIELCSDLNINDPANANLRLKPRIKHSNELSIDKTSYDSYGSQCQLFHLSFRPVTAGSKHYQIASDDCAQGTESCDFSLGITVSVKTPDQYQQELMGRFYQLGQYLITGKGSLVKNLVFINNDKQLVISGDSNAFVYHFDRTQMRLEYSHSFPISDDAGSVLCSGQDNSVIQLNPERGSIQRLDTQGQTLSSSTENSLNLCRSLQKSNLRIIGSCSESDGDASGFLEARVRAFDGFRWGYVCDDNIDQTEIDVACNELGYASGVIVPYDDRLRRCGRAPRNDFVIDQLACEGNEEQVIDCEFMTDHNCYLDEALAVECSGSTGESQHFPLHSLSLCSGISSAEDSIIQFCGGLELHRADLTTIYDENIMGAELVPSLERVSAGQHFNPTAYMPLYNNTVLLTNETHGMLIDTTRSVILDSTSILKGRPLLAIVENNLVGISPDIPGTLIWQEIVDGRFSPPEFRQSSGIKAPKTIAATNKPGIIAVAEQTAQDETLITFYGVSLPDVARPQLFHEQTPNNSTTDAPTDDYTSITDRDNSASGVFANSKTVLESLLVFSILTLLVQ